MKQEDYVMLCYFNALLDRALGEILTEGKTKVDIGRWLNSTKASKTVAEDVVETLTRNRSELDAAANDPQSEQREGYSYLSKPKFTRYHKFMCDSQEDSLKFLEKEYPKKKRRAKPVDPEKIVKNLNFLQKEEGLGLQSINPKDILGAAMLTVYNAKTRSLTLYIGGEDGLSVKGSTLLGWDKDKSFSKRLRKPETAGLFTSIGFAVVQQKFNEIKTKTSKPNGRINANTVLLWSKKAQR